MAPCVIKNSTYPKISRYNPDFFLRVCASDETFNILWFELIPKYLRCWRSTRPLANEGDKLLPIHYYRCETYILVSWIYWTRNCSSLAEFLVLHSIHWLLVLSTYQKTMNVKQIPGFLPSSEGHQTDASDQFKPYSFIWDIAMTR